MKYITLNNKKYLNTKLSSNQNQESDLFIYNNYLFKRLKSYFIDKDRIRTIEELNSIKDKEYVTPIYGIQTVSQRKIGYLMNYYKDYLSLTNYCFNPNLTFNERKEIAKKICLLIRKLEDYDILYTDIHSDNILIKDNDIKLIDMDSVTMPWVKNIDRELLKIYIENYLCDLSFQILTASDNVFKRKIPYNQRDELYYISNSNQIEFLNHLFEKVYDDYDTINHIDDFDEETIKQMRRIMEIKL